MNEKIHFSTRPDALWDTARLTHSGGGGWTCMCQRTWTMNLSIDAVTGAVSNRDFPDTAKEPQPRKSPHNPWRISHTPSGQDRARRSRQHTPVSRVFKSSWLTSQEQGVKLRKNSLRCHREQLYLRYNRSSAHPGCPRRRNEDSHVERVGRRHCTWLAWPQDDCDRLATENLAMLTGERAASQTYIGTITATV